MGEEPVNKKTGLRHMFSALRYSLQGVGRLLGEQAFRHELMAFAGGLVLLALVGAGPFSFLGFTILMLLLFAVEALNTAIEEIVDRVSPEISPVGKHAKDLGSFACFCLILANGIFLVWAVFFG
ncbi:diacylglycerol kinase [Rhizobiaceae bacterium BDR2-2]|uniref:Diacylglycerol kinase n=1 Tax=Ectorhizobium quercum TaxID=2965071 RepID=A0AAE3N3A8_9HYPH|nr:diacylglycerol kinase [Ectorhizobium quercum]MCX8999814.1 diacylglycerol kinase [Ectorhizobium quercum]